MGEKVNQKRGRTNLIGKNAQKEDKQESTEHKRRKGGTKKGG